MPDEEPSGGRARAAARKPYAAPRVIFSELRVKEDTGSGGKTLHGNLTADYHTHSTVATS